MVHIDNLPSLEIEVGAPNSAKYTPVVAGQIIAGIAIGIVIAIND